MYKRQLKRFIALAVICLLGVTMIVGLRAACLDLRPSADEFFDAQHLFDAVSYTHLSPWLENFGGWAAAALPALLVLAGSGMIVGSQLGGRCGDLLSPGRAAAIGQGIACAAMLLRCV